MKGLFNREIKTGAFTIDFSRVNPNPCKGVLSVEVRPMNRMDTLIIDNCTSDLISHENPFKIPISNVPIVSGVVNFNPYTKEINGYKSPKDMKSVVTYIFEQ